MDAVPSRFTNGGGVLLFPDFLSQEEIAEALAYQGETNVEANGVTYRHKIQVPTDSDYFNQVCDKVALRLVQDDVINAIQPWTDYSWRSVFNHSPGTMELAITRYVPGYGYGWHVDHADGYRRILNFIITLTTVHAGELLWSTDAMPKELTNQEAWRDFDPYIEGHVNQVAGQMVVMPAHYPHRVLPSQEDRIVMHGHMSL